MLLLHPDVQKQQEGVGEHHTWKVGKKEKTCERARCSAAAVPATTVRGLPGGRGGGGGTSLQNIILITLGCYTHTHTQREELHFHPPRVDRLETTAAHAVNKDECFSLDLAPSELGTAFGVFQQVLFIVRALSRWALVLGRGCF